MAALMCLSFSSCREDAEIPPTGPAGEPQVASAATYAGTWTRLNTTTNVETVSEGTITLAAGEFYAVSVITAACPDFAEFPLTSTTNITYGGRGFFYANIYTGDATAGIEGNGFGAPFSGEIYTDVNPWEINIFFQITTREGRTTVTNRYSFVGHKQ